MFSKDKAIHSLEVANFMKDRAYILKLDADKAWLVGYIHDIGYTKTNDNHAKAGSEMIQDYSDDLAYYISVHDSLNYPKDHMEFLLRLADLVVDETGKYVGIKNRIDSICRRRSSIKRENLEKMVLELERYAVDNNIKNVMRDCY